MKTYRFSAPVSLLERISYTDPVELKALLKYVLSSSNNNCSDTTELCILADLKTILGFYDSSKDLKVLTAKQKQVIIEHIINDKTQTEVAKELLITQQGVSVLLYSALKRIKDYINTGELKWVPWTDEEKYKLMNKYNTISINKLSKELNRSPNKVISMYHYLKNKGKGASDGIEL